MRAIVQPPEIMEIVDVAQIPARGHASDGLGAACKRKDWKKLILQVFDLPSGKAVKLHTPEQAAWVAGRLLTLAKNMEAKIKVAVRRDVMYVYWLQQPQKNGRKMETQSA